VTFRKLNLFAEDLAISETKKLANYKLIVKKESGDTKCCGGVCSNLFAIRLQSKIPLSVSIPIEQPDARATKL
jgi:hypothetical protein